MANNPQASGSGAPPLRPPMGAMAPQGYGGHFPMQFRPGMHVQQGPPFPLVPNAQQFHPVGPGQNVGLGGPGAPFSSSYTFAPPSFGQTQNGVNVSSQFQTSLQVLPPPPMGGQPWLQPANQSASTVTHIQQATLQPSTSVLNASDWKEFEAADGRRYYYNKVTKQSSWEKPLELITPIENASDWQEFEAADGRRCYYNKVTKQSSWEKPLELMTPIERADASTVWKEFTTAEGKRYYYNRKTKQSNWTNPEEPKLAREQAEKAASLIAASQEVTLHTAVSAAATPPSVDQPSPAVTSVVSSVIIDATSTPNPVTLVATAITSPAVTTSGSPAVITSQPTSAIPSVTETVTPDKPKSLDMHMDENNTSLAVESSGGEASTVAVELWAEFSHLAKELRRKEKLLALSQSMLEKRKLVYRRCIKFIQDATVVLQNLKANFGSGSIIEAFDVMRKLVEEEKKEPEVAGDREQEITASPPGLTAKTWRRLEINLPAYIARYRERLPDDFSSHEVELQAKRRDLKASWNLVCMKTRIVRQELRELAIANHVVTDVKGDFRHALAILRFLTNNWANNGKVTPPQGTKRIWTICWELVRPPDFDDIDVLKSIDNCVDEDETMKRLAKLVDYVLRQRLEYHRITHGL